MLTCWTGFAVFVSTFAGIWVGSGWVVPSSRLDFDQRALVKNLFRLDNFDSFPRLLSDVVLVPNEAVVPGLWMVGLEPGSEVGFDGNVILAGSSKENNQSMERRSLKDFLKTRFDEADEKALAQCNA